MVLRSYLAPMTRTLLPLAAMLLFGCAKAKTEPAPAASSSTNASTNAARAPEAQVAPVAPSPSGAVGSAGRVLLTVEDRLLSERDRKTEGTPRAEDVYVALEKGGVALTDKKQHVATIYSALYCLGAKGPGGTAYSVCEYASAEELKKGRDSSAKFFESVPNRELVANKKTLLTVRQPPVKTPESEAVAKKSVELFSKL